MASAKMKHILTKLMGLLLCGIAFSAEVPAWKQGLTPHSAQALYDGFYCQHGEYNGTPLYWKAIDWPRGNDTPGVVIDSGRINPWVPVNSLSFSEGKEYEWVGWNSGCPKYKQYWDIENKKAAIKEVGTWGDQVDKKGPGVYVPTWRDGAEGAYSLVIDQFGASSYEGVIDPSLEVLREYPWCNAGFAMKVDATDDEERMHARNMILEGHEILSNSYDYTPATGLWQYFYHGETLPAEDPSIPFQIRNLVVDTTLSGAGLRFNVSYLDYKDGNPMLPETLSYEATYTVSYDYEEDKNPDLEMNVWKNKGRIKAVHKGWNEVEGKNVTMLKVECLKPWSDGSKQVNMKVSKAIIDDSCYRHADVWNNAKDHPEGFTTGYFVFPKDRSSNKELIDLKEAGYIGARGGSNWGEVTPGDFYDPFRINFDNTFLLDASGSKVFPDNPWMKLGVTDMVDQVVKSKGYMQRAFTGAWDHDEWQCNCPITHIQQWGTLTLSLFRQHLKYLDELRNEHKIYVAPPSEIIKYRMTANAVVQANLVEKSDCYSLDVEMEDVPEQYQDEISVIVKLDEPMDKCDSRYEETSKRAPRYQPRKMDEEGYVWSISLNPFEGRVLFYRPLDNPVLHQSHLNKMNPVLSKSSGKQIRISLPKGEYSGQIHTATGREVYSSEMVSTSQYRGINVECGHMAQGVYFLQVQQNGHEVLRERFVIR